MANAESIIITHLCLAQTGSLGLKPAGTGEITRFGTVPAALISAANNEQEVEGRGSCGEGGGGGARSCVNVHEHMISTAATNRNPAA